VIGLRVGLSVGPRVGFASGLTEDPWSAGDASGGIPGVTRDAASGIYFPATAGEWTIVLGIAGIATGGPSAIYNFQEVSGNPADATGTFPLTASGTGLVYAQAIAGYTRLAVGTTSGGTGVFSTTSASLPDIATDSQLTMAVVLPSTIATTRDVHGGGAAGTRVNSQLVATTGQARGMSVGNNATGIINSGGAVRPWVLKHDRTANATTLYTDAEKITPTFGGTSAGKSITFGNFVAGAGTCRYLYAATWITAAALIPEAKIRTLLQTLGWTVLW